MRVSASSKLSTSSSVASLANLGNTCFLNSVLYTLRFTPGFLHGLHHLAQDARAQQQAAKKHAGCPSCPEAVVEVIERLHELFRSMANVDDSGGNNGLVSNNGSNNAALEPTALLAAVAKLSPIFEGNAQQDAHELLYVILNTMADVKIVENVDLASLNEVNNKKSGRRVVSNGVVNSNKFMANFVVSKFEGKSVMRTRCLECEVSSFRSESFTNIDVPLQIEDEDDERCGRSLFIKQIMMSETLRENNKYWCETCSRLNEAQRSVHYELLPQIMVLQLKRFTAATGNTSTLSSSKSYMSKINDYIPTPFSLDCFCTECMPTSKPRISSSSSSSSNAKHHYRLYAVIMHLGATLASGHYVAYVRAGVDALHDYYACQRSPSGVERKQKKGLMQKILRRSANHSDSSRLISPTEASVNSNCSTLCRSISCCGIRGTLWNNLVNCCQEHFYSAQQNGQTESGQPELRKLGGDPDLWLECDDESIQVISRKQFEDVLSCAHTQQGAATPYLLFYQRV